MYWNMLHLGHAVVQRQSDGLSVLPERLARISALGWAHILLTGEYRWPRTGGGHTLQCNLALSRNRPEQAMPELAEQAERLFACRFHFGQALMPVIRTSTPRPPAGGAHERLPVIAPLRARQPDLSEELCEEMSRRRLTLCLHTLRAVQHCSFALDVYLWDTCYGDCALPGAPPARSRLARYQALADHPLPWPSPEERRAFEHDLAKARDKLRRLWDETHPPEDFHDDIPF